jgi:hypothetical protein
MALVWSCDTSVPTNPPSVSGTTFLNLTRDGKPRKLWGQGPAGTQIPLSVLQGAEVRDVTIQSIDRAQHVRNLQRVTGAREVVEGVPARRQQRLHVRALLERER